MIVGEMRRFLLTIKAFMLAAVVTGCLVFVYVLKNFSVFPKGERHEFYRGTSSEEIVIARSPFEKLLLSDIKGESVSYRGDKAQELISRFRAEILFIEEAAGVTNYYCYSPALENSIVLNGKKVNLHIAVSGENTAAGTPVIFGGF